MTAFDRADEQGAGFTYSIDGQTARHQLKLSAGVVVMLAIAIVTAVLTLGAAPLSPPSDLVSIRAIQQADSLALPPNRS